MMNNTKRLRKKSQSIQSQLITRFTGIFILLVIALGLLILGATAFHLYDSTKQETKGIEEALSQVETQRNQEWKDTLRLYIAADDPRYFIRVALADGSTVYSNKAYFLYSNFDNLKQTVFAKDILWDNNDPYYFYQFTVGNSKVALMTSMEDNFEILLTLLQWILILSLFVLFLGVLLIYRFSKKLSLPFIQMNEEIQSLASNGPANQNLSEADHPKEARQIAISFNHLLQQQRETLNREQQFISDASHELKTPLAAILGHVNLIQRRGTEHPEVIKKSLSFIDKEASRMAILTQQLLLLDREKIRSEQQQWLLLVPIINNVIEEIPLTGQQLELHFDDTVKIYGQKEHFYQIIRNLFENAVKYTPAEGLISISLTKDVNHIRLKISNTGITISDEEKKLIFQRFYRIDPSRSSEISGSGLGLAIVKQLTELYHGQIEVSDLRPQGVCFTLTFSN